MAKLNIHVGKKEESQGRSEGLGRGREGRLGDGGQEPLWNILSGFLHPKTISAGLDS